MLRPGLSGVGAGADALNSTRRSSQFCVLLAVFASLVVSTAFCQSVPSSGSPQDPQKQLATVPETSDTIELQVARPAVELSASNFRLRPAAFRIRGANLLDDQLLLTSIERYVGQDMDFKGLNEVAEVIREKYRRAGYLLTTVYFPEQSFQSQGGTVEIAVLEARIGAVTVTAEPGMEKLLPFAQALLEKQMPSGGFIAKSTLETPLLLLRDLEGVTASAVVSPGTEVGESDVAVTLSREGRSPALWLGVDNFGPAAIGEYRASLNGSVSNLLGRGDVLSATLQGADRSGTLLYRAEYRGALSPLGTQGSLTATRSEYVLGGAFAELGASGRADVFSLAALHPIRRSRGSNLFLQVGLDYKSLKDEVDVLEFAPRKDVLSGRVGLVGNFADGQLGTDAVTRFAIQATAGTLDIRDALSLAVDQSNFGPRTDGDFQKLNFELQRVQAVSVDGSVVWTMSAQLASRNLTSAEKLGLTGPGGVRGYFAEAGSVVDQGVFSSLEYRHVLPFRPLGGAAQASVFYDIGNGKFDRVRNASTNSQLTGERNTVTFDSIGAGFSVGFGRGFQISSWAATPLDSSPANSSRSRTRVWISAQWAP
ncbi:MAG: ShlB/FhaC/HecB family hemolysin secretion/activation protein [Sinobacteraceae bacterium]|nr:ShlB/FhaC/HecB family hemolysin secretion/activation protein [Nevskiaceae bacterium]